MMKNPYWSNHAIYQIYPRSFCDSNGDGIGDIPGIISKLDYLQRLGIHIVWLSPLYRSPNDDFGYDISDYEAINPEYGTMEDMERLIAEAKKRDIFLVMDLVVNHTSDEHPWFLASKDKNSPYHDYYYWREGKNGKAPNNWTSVFPGSAWEYVPEVGQYYLHIYGKKQPDLNWHNPKVLEEVEKILRFWLDKGIYGFRCDVINQIWKDSLENGKGHSPSGRGMEHYLSRPGDHDILKKLRSDVFEHYDCIVIGETVNVDYPNGREFLDQELDMFFQFDTTGVGKPATPLYFPHFSSQKFMEKIYGWQKEVAWNANYLENHDQPRSINRFGDPAHHWKESGKMLALLNFTLRGTPFVYEGEELGMLNYPRMEEPKDYQDVSAKNTYQILKKYRIFSEKRIRRFVDVYNRDHERCPFPWDSSKNAGFSSSDKPWLPIEANVSFLNAESEEKDPDSIFAFYQKLIALRLEDQTLALGSIEPLPLPDPLYAYRRIFEGRSEKILFNFSSQEKALPKDFSLEGTLRLATYSDTCLKGKRTLRAYEGLLLQEK
jgi:oligo-1,6-glucosidase